MVGRQTGSESQAYRLTETKTIINKYVYLYIYIWLFMCMQKNSIRTNKYIYVHFCSSIVGEKKKIYIYRYIHLVVYVHINMTFETYSRGERNTDTYSVNYTL